MSTPDAAGATPQNPPQNPPENPPETSHGHRRPFDVVLDVDDDALARALVAAWSPHRVHRVTATSGPAATAAVADTAAAVVVCAPVPSGDDDTVHRIALRARWWAVAAPVVGARVVLVSTAEVFDRHDTDDVRPDEFTVAAPTSVVGRARGAAEVEVAATSPPGVVVRHGPSADATELAATVRWAAVAAGPGPWHHPDPVLDDRHTRLVRADADGELGGAPGRDA